MRRGYKEAIIESVILMIANKQTLPAKFKQHKLSGDYSDCWKCPLNPDWLLIWQTDDDKNILIFVRTGTHSGLF